MGSDCICDLQQHEVPSPEPVALDEGDGVDDARNGRKDGDDFGKHPLSVSANMRFLCSMEVDSVQANDGDGQDELEEAENRTGNGTDCAARVRVVT